MDEKGNETIMADEDIGREGSSTDSRDAVEEKRTSGNSRQNPYAIYSGTLKAGEGTAEYSGTDRYTEGCKEKNTNRSYKRFPVRVFSGGDIKWRVCLWQII